MFGEADLQRVAGERSFGRGQGYLDAVGDLEFGVGQLTAQAAAAAKARSLETWLDRLSRDDLLGLVREQVRDDRGAAPSREAARLRTATGQAAAISPADAIVAAHASATSDPVILTSDPSDLAALAEHAARPITITPA